MPRTIPAEPTWLKAGVQERPVGVDREKRVILGYVVAQEGPFKSEGRGEFNEKSLKKIVSLMRQNDGGTKIRFGHPTLSDDGLGKFLGRAKNPRLDTVTVKRNGEITSLLAVRADAHIAEVAMQPSASGFALGEHVLARAEEDPDSFSSSLVLQVDEEFRLDKDQKPLRDDNGNELPPLWHPKVIHASDVVDTGDAVDSFLAAEIGLPDRLLREGYEMFLGFLPGQPREVVEARLLSWLGKALDQRFGEVEKDRDRLRDPLLSLFGETCVLNFEGSLSRAFLRQFEFTPEGLIELRFERVERIGDPPEIVEPDEASKPELQPVALRERRLRMRKRVYGDIW